MKNVLLESKDFNVASLNFVLGDSKENWIFGNINRLNPMESRQYLFSLTPRTEIKLDPTLAKSVSAIGKLDIVWLSGIGEKGHIQTSKLERTVTINFFLYYLAYIYIWILFSNKILFFVFRHQVVIM